MVDDVHAKFERIDEFLENFDQYDNVNSVPSFLSLDGLLNIPVVIGPTPQICSKLCIEGLGDECIELAVRGDVVVIVLDLPLSLGSKTLRVFCVSKEGKVLYERETVFEVQGNLISSKQGDKILALPQGSLPPISPLSPKLLRPPRIALVTGTKVGGAELAATEECRTLKMLGYEVTVIVMGGAAHGYLLDKFKNCSTSVVYSGPAPDDESALSELRHAESWEQVGRVTKNSLEGLRSACTAKKHDIVVVPFTKTPATETFQHIFRLFSSETKFVLQLSNTLRPREVIFKTPPDGIIFPSSFVASSLRGREFIEGTLKCGSKGLLAEKGWVKCREEGRKIATAIINPIVMQPIEQRRKEKAGDGMRVGFVGRLSGERMPGAFLAVAKEVLGVLGEGVTFFLVGGGDMLEPLKVAARSMGIGDSVEFLGEVASVEVRNLLVELNLDVVVNPSIETFGRGTVESLSAGAVVVGCDGGGTPEIIEHGVTGLLVDCSNYLNLANGVLDVWREKQNDADKFERTRAVVARRVEQSYTEEIRGSALNNFYTRVLGEGLGGGMDDIVRRSTTECVGKGEDLESCIEGRMQATCEGLGSRNSICASYLMARGCSNNGFSGWQCTTVINDSGLHWEENYAYGGTSGEGSAGVEAKWKANVLNEFIEQQGISSCVELGTGDGVTLSLTTGHKKYTGYDVSATIVRNLNEKFNGDQTKEFIHYDGKLIQAEKTKQAQMALSMEVLFHLVEDEVFETYLQNLFSLGKDYVVVMSSNCEEDIRLKGALESIMQDSHEEGSVRVRNSLCTDPSQHVRHRAFLGRILEQERFKNWALMDFVPQKYPGLCFSDFYFFKHV